MLHKKFFVIGTCLFIGILVHISAATGGSLQDPTKPELRDTGAQETATSSQSKKISWELSCIIYSASRKLAVINGDIINIGDSVTGGKVLDINPNSVVLSYRGKRHKLQLISDRQETMGK